jgi:hypothetical protein
VLAILWLFLIYREIERGQEPDDSSDDETAIAMAAD